MINIQIDEKDKHVLRVTASYFLALAGDISTEITGEVVSRTYKDGTTATGPAPLPEQSPTFNAAELAENPQPAPTTGAADPATVFGGKPSDAPYSADAVASSTAPADSPATTSIPTPPSVPVPPAVSTGSTAAPAVPPTASPAPGVDVDARGLPWDARIHSREKTKLVNGNWKNKRGVDENLLQTVEAQLAQAMAIPAASSPAPSVSVPVPPPTPTPPVLPTAAPTATSASPSEPFPDLMKLIVSATTQNKLTQAQVNEVINAHGFAVLPLVSSRPDLIPAIEQAIKAKIAENGHPL
jgi:hypothetical protein